MPNLGDVKTEQMLFVQEMQLRNIYMMLLAMMGRYPLFSAQWLASRFLYISPST